MVLLIAYLVIGVPLAGYYVYLSSHPANAHRYGTHRPSARSTKSKLR